MPKFLFVYNDTYVPRPTLSKSDYMLFLRHPAWLWLKKYDKSKLPPIDENLQAMFDAGAEFESYAEKVFGTEGVDAVKVGFNSYDEYLTLIPRTQKALESLTDSKSNVDTLLQGGLAANNLNCIVDVLKRVSSDSTDKDLFDLIEIKSSTKAKPEHIYDLAFQLLVCEGAGIQIRKIKVAHVNNKYKRNDEIAPEKITSVSDVTDEVRALHSLTETEVQNAFHIVEQRSIPDISPMYSNKLNIPYVSWDREWLDIFKTLKPSLPEYNVYEWHYPKKEQFELLEAANIISIKDIPLDDDNLNLSEKQKLQIITTKEDRTIIESDKIKEFIDTFEYPLYFFDYETFSSVIPYFDGLKPYSDYPFQYSLHVIPRPKRPLELEPPMEHKEYIHTDFSNPMPGLLDSLTQDIGTKGTILSWNMSYEKKCNDRMAELYPKHKKFLQNINDRMEDLMIPFSKCWYVDKDFYGSASLKYVLPVLVPGLSYKELDISDGLLARRIWTNTFIKQENNNNIEKVRKQLSEYCTLDTYAMVRVWLELLECSKNV